MLKHLFYLSTNAFRMKYKRNLSNTMEASSEFPWFAFMHLLDLPGDTEIEPHEESFFSRPVL